LYDFALPGNIEIDNLPNAPRLKAFHVQFRDYIPGFASGSSSQHIIDESGQVLESLSTARPLSAYQEGPLISSAMSAAMPSTSLTTLFLCHQLPHLRLHDRSR